MGNGSTRYGMDVEGRMRNELQIPDELAKIYSEHKVYLFLRDILVRLPFRIKSAFRCGMKAHEKNIEFWRGIKKLYPEVDTEGEWAYDSIRQVIGRMGQ